MGKKGAAILGISQYCVVAMSSSSWMFFLSGMVSWDVHSDLAAGNSSRQCLDENNQGWSCMCWMCVFTRDLDGCAPSDCCLTCDSAHLSTHVGMRIGLYLEL